MTEGRPYPTAAGVENAIRDAAKKAAAADPSLDVNKRIQLEYFNRFLSRVFCEGDGSEWVLKGGTGILARVPSTRATRDIDLYRQGFLTPSSAAHGTTAVRAALLTSTSVSSRSKSTVEITRRS